MSKHSNANPMGFAFVGNTTISSFFAFITGATTVNGLFLGIFGLTSFSYILVGDPFVNMYSVLQGLSMLPNPLEFVRDCNSILVTLSKYLSRIDVFTSSTGNNILDALLSVIRALATIGAYAFAFIISALLLPFYLVYFFLRCVACLFLALGVKWSALNILSKPWQPITFILGLMR